MKSMKPVIQLLQKELGDTIPPITDHFFIWLCFFFPGGDNLLKEHRLSFKDARQNEKPTIGSVQSAIGLFQQNIQTEAGKTQDLVSEWKNDDEEESQYSKMIKETIHLLFQRSEIKLLKRLEEDARRSYRTLASLAFRFVPPQVLLRHLAIKSTEYNLA